MAKKSDKPVDNSRNNYTENRKNIEIDKNVHHFHQKSYSIPKHSEDRIDFTQRKEQQYESIKSKKDEDIGDFTKNYDYISNKYDEYMRLLDELNYKKYSIEYYIDIQSKIQISIDKIVKELEELKIQKNISSKQTHIKQLNQYKFHYVEIYQKYEQLIQYKKIYEIENGIDRIAKEQDVSFDKILELLKKNHYTSDIEKIIKDEIAEFRKNLNKDIDKLYEHGNLTRDEYDNLKKILLKIENNKNKSTPSKIISFFKIVENILDEVGNKFVHLPIIRKLYKRPKLFYTIIYIISVFFVSWFQNKYIFNDTDIPLIVESEKIIIKLVNQIKIDANKILLNQLERYYLDFNTTVYFQNGQSNMDDGNTTKLLNFIKEHKNPIKINLIGYATSTGLHKPDKYASNKELAQARAQNIKVFLVEHNITTNENIDISYKVEENDTNPNNQKVKVLFYKSLLRK